MTARGGGAAVPRQFLAFDVGTHRTGVASGNTTLGDATPLQTLHGAEPQRLAAALRLVAEWRPDAVVVGMPRHPDGTPHAMTRVARRFVQQMREATRLPIVEVDERWSTVEAERDGTRGAHRTGIDAEAAAVILRQHLHAMRDAMPTAHRPGVLPEDVRDDPTA